MLDEYAMNKETGELVPVTVVIREFYKTHGPLDRWTDEWEPTGFPVEGLELSPPDFSGAVKKI